jgi:NAD(P)H-dependent FMN reductase
MAKLAESFIADKAAVSISTTVTCHSSTKIPKIPAPAGVARIRQTVAEAEAVWVFTLSTTSVPRLLKNLIDWLSRPWLLTTLPLHRAGRQEVHHQRRWGQDGNLEGTGEASELLKFVNATC